MSEKKKNKTRIQVIVDRKEWAKFKGLRVVRDQSQDDALTEAIQLYNDKHKGVMG